MIKVLARPLNAADRLRFREDLKKTNRGLFGKAKNNNSPVFIWKGNMVALVAGSIARQGFVPNGTQKWNNLELTIYSKADGTWPILMGLMPSGDTLLVCPIDTHRADSGEHEQFEAEMKDLAKKVFGPDYRIIHDKAEAYWFTYTDTHYADVLSTAERLKFKQVQEQNGYTVLIRRDGWVLTLYHRNPGMPKAQLTCKLQWVHPTAFDLPNWTAL